MDKKSIICPGCGAQIESENNNLDKDFNALVACRELMFKLSYYTLSLHDDYFIHQLAVDAYAAQHSGKKVKAISTAFALVGLYLFNKKNYSGRQVQLAHIEMANKSKIWLRFMTPKEKTWMTVKDVIESSDNNKNEAIKKWNQSVWEIWKLQKEKVSELTKRYLDI